MNNIEKYPICHMRTYLGNCYPIGGFCTSVNEPICDAFHKLTDRPIGWIPISERVPDEAEVVLACNKNGIMMVGHIFICHNGEWQAYTNDDEMDWVTAWMPLPEPYNCGAKMKGDNE